MKREEVKGKACSECGAPAVVRWPVGEGQESRPYCQRCLLVSVEKVPPHMCGELASDRGLR